MLKPSLTFKAAFCDYFHIAPENFVREAVFKCAFPQNLIFFRVLYALQTVTARESMRFMEKVGRTQEDEELEDVISEYHNDVADTSTFLARRLNLRVSARKVAQLNQLIRGRKPLPSFNSTHFYRQKKVEKNVSRSR